MIQKEIGGQRFQSRTNIRISGNKSAKSPAKTGSSTNNVVQEGRFDNQPAKFSQDTRGQI